MGRRAGVSVQVWLGWVGLGWVYSMSMAFFAFKYICAFNLYRAHGSKKRALDLLRLKILVVVSHHVGAEN